MDEHLSADQTGGALHVHLSFPQSASCILYNISEVVPLFVAMGIFNHEVVRVARRALEGFLAHLLLLEEFSK